MGGMSFAMDAYAELPIIEFIFTLDSLSDGKSDDHSKSIYGVSNGNLNLLNVGKNKITISFGCILYNLCKNMSNIV